MPDSPSTAKPKPAAPKSKGLLIEDLLLGEYHAMEMSAECWQSLMNINRKYLTSLIARIENNPGSSPDTGKNNRMSIPLFKMILFFATHLQDHVAADKELQASLREHREAQARRAFVGLPEMPD